MDLGLIDSTRAKANDREDDLEVLSSLSDNLWNKCQGYLWSRLISDKRKLV